MAAGPGHTMKLLTWNINHRASRKHIPPLMAEAIDSLDPDAIILSEYVPGPSHERFMVDLESCGLSHVLMSQFTAKQNHILIASRKPLMVGDIRAPPIAAAFPSNVLHVHIPDEDFDILGLRIPDYSKQPLIRRECWKWILARARDLRERPSVILGDFNTDPNYSHERCGDCIGQMVTEGWQHAKPQGSSYWTINGEIGRQLDHAFVSEHFSVNRAEYIVESGPYVFAGKRVGAMSDHAILLIDIDQQPVHQ